MRKRFAWQFLLSSLVFPFAPAVLPQSDAPKPIVLHAARLLDIEAGKIISPGEVLVQGDRIIEVGSSIKHPASS